MDSLRNLLHFSMIGSDLRESKELVQRLSVPESTKTFVFAIKVPEHDSTIYLLSVQNLSQRSATDAECLIRELRPDAVLTQVNVSAFGEDEEGSADTMVPTSAFKVLARCLSDESFTKEKYQSVANNLVMEEIFGTSFSGHLLSVQKVAEEVGSTFKVLDSPIVMEGLTSSLTRQDYYYGSALGSTRFEISNDQQSLMQRLLSSHITHLSNEMESDSPRVPPFAISVYNLLVELHNIFNHLPDIREALDTATKMLSDVNNGEAIDTEALSEVHLFRIAVERLRIALNNTARLPIKNQGTKVQFSDLSLMDKSYALMADDLRSQAKKFKNIVAVVDAGNLAGLRRHWRTCVPQQVKDTVQKGFDSNDDDSGAGALTLSNARFLNFFLRHKAMAYPSRVMTKPMSIMKSFLSADTIRGATQYVLASAEGASLEAMRAGFYAMMMRKRLAKPIGALPMVVFGGGLATCAGLLYCEERIECAAVTLPSAPEIAKLGRGIKNLREATGEVTRRGDRRVHNAMEGLTLRLRNLTLTLNFKTKFGS